MVAVLVTLGMIIFPIMSVYFVVETRQRVNAPWYGTVSERLYLYVFPPGFMLFGTGCAIEAFDRYGAPWPDWLAGGLALPLVILTLLGLMGMVIPYPGFVTPKWVRERRQKDRDAKKQRRADMTSGR